jgi:hypothetical protein
MNIVLELIQPGIHTNMIILYHTVTRFALICFKIYEQNVNYYIIIIIIIIMTKYMKMTFQILLIIKTKATILEYWYIILYCYDVPMCLDINECHNVPYIGYLNFD